MNYISKSGRVMRFVRAVRWLCISGVLVLCLVFMIVTGLNGFYVSTNVMHRTTLDTIGAKILPVSLTALTGLEFEIPAELGVDISTLLEKVYVKEGEKIRRGSALYALSTTKIDRVLEQKKKELLVLQIRWVCMLHGKNIESIANDFGLDMPRLDDTNTVYTIKKAQQICDIESQHGVPVALLKKIEKMDAQRSLVEEQLAEIKAYQEVPEVDKNLQASYEKKFRMLSIMGVYLERSISEAYVELDGHMLLPSKNNTYGKEALSTEIDILERGIKALSILRDNRIIRAEKEGRVFSINSNPETADSPFIQFEQQEKTFYVEIAAPVVHLNALRRHLSVSLLFDESDEAVNVRIERVNFISPPVGKASDVVSARLFFTAQNTETLANIRNKKAKIDLVWALEPAPFSNVFWKVLKSGVFVSSAEASGI